MVKHKIFLASSSELKEDRKDFEILIGRKNKEWVDQGVYLDLIVWEDFLDALSHTRLQDEYDKEIRGCDIFVMLFHTKVGRFTEEEFQTAVGQFKATNKPFIFTYFKNPQNGAGSANQQDRVSLHTFQDKLKALGHFQTVFENIDQLGLHFYRQLDKLKANGFIRFEPDSDAAVAPGSTTYDARLSGSGAIAQGPGAMAAGPGGVNVRGNNSGTINTGTQTNIDTGGGAHIGRDVYGSGGDFVGRDKIIHGMSPAESKPLFDELLKVVEAQAPPGQRAKAVQQVGELKAEVAKGKQANDGTVAKLIESLVGLVPGAESTVASTFVNPILGGIAGPVTKYVLDKLKPD